MATHKVNPGEKLDSFVVKPGDILDYGDGSQALVIDPSHRPDEGQLEEIAYGFSGAAAMEDRVGDRENNYFSSPLDGNRWARAANLTRTSPFNMNFFSDEVGLSKSYEDDATEAMRLAERYYRLDAIAGRIIELMSQFSIAGMRHQLNDKDVKAFYDGWSNQIFLTQILNRVFLNYYLYGNVYILKTLVNYKQGEFDENFKYQIDPEAKSTAKMSADEMQLFEKLSENYNIAFAKYMDNSIDAVTMSNVRDLCIEEWEEKASAARKNVWSKSMIPGTYTVLDPKSVKIYGPGDFNLGIMTYKVSDALKKMVEDPTDVGGGLALESKHVAYQKKLLLNVPKEILNQIKQGAREVILDPNYVSSIHRMKMDFDTLAFPLMTRAFKALHMKNRLREMDNATINNFISQLLIIRVGSEQSPAKPGQMDALAKAYKEAIQTKTLVLFWNHTLEVERVPVDLDVLGSEKYEVWNNDIRDAFGVSPVLLGRSEGSSGSSFMSVKGFLENLAQGREDVLNQFLYPEYHGIAVAQGFAGYPEVVFDKFKLDDESSAINTLVKLVQSGIIDYETAAEDLGKDWKQILARHEEQAPMKDDGIIRLASPYQANDGAPAAGSDSQSGGRPGGDGQKGGQPNSRPKSKNANPQKKVTK